MYAKKKPIQFEELDWNQFIELQQDEEEDGPLVKIPFSIRTPYFRKKFNLDLIIWNLSADNMAITQRVVRYVLKNFDKLFETGWTMLYYNLKNIDDCNQLKLAEHTLSDFYREQIYFKAPYSGIQLEINCRHLADGIARYCFIVSTVCDYQKWMISDDDMRLYMVDNKCYNNDTNNVDTQLLSIAEGQIDQAYGNDEQGKKYAAAIYQKMEQEGFQYAPSFQEFEQTLN